MARAKVNLSDISTLTSASQKLESSANDAITKAQNIASKNISLLSTTASEIDRLLSSCSSGISELQNMKSCAEKERKGILKMLELVPPTKEKTVQRYDGKVETVNEPNPEYIRLQNQLTQKNNIINNCNTSIRAFNDFRSECTSQKHDILSAKTQLETNISRLDSLKNNYSSKCSNANKKLETIAKFIEEYISTSVPIASTKSQTGFLGWAWRGAKSTFQTIGQYTTLVTSIMSPVIASYSSTPNALRNSEVNSYVSLKERMNKNKRDKENELSAKEKAIPKITDPKSPTPRHLEHTDIENTQIIAQTNLPEFESNDKENTLPKKKNDNKKTEATSTPTSPALKKNDVAPPQKADTLHKALSTVGMISLLCGPPHSSTNINQEAPYTVESEENRLISQPNKYSSEYECSIDEQIITTIEVEEGVKKIIYIAADVTESVVSEIEKNRKYHTELEKRLKEFDDKTKCSKKQNREKSMKPTMTVQQENKHTKQILKQNTLK